MMAEIAMKAKILRERLRKSPESVLEVLGKLERLEGDMVFCLFELERAR
jgi:hypothetical protein